MTPAEVISTVYKKQVFWQLMLDESEFRSGPFDGGCLVCAKAMIRASGEGGLVRIASNRNPAEHYGAMIDGRVHDFSGVYESPEAWIEALRGLGELDASREWNYAEGYVDSETPDDPHTEKRVAALLMDCGFYRKTQARRNQP